MPFFKQSKKKNKNKKPRIRNRKPSNQQDAENENSKSCTELTESITDIDIHETDSSPIEKLDDDHLRIIFSYLSKRQLIGIERVCKKWKEVALSVWSKQTVLNFDIMSSSMTDDWDHFGTDHLESVLMRCGEYLKTFKLDCPKDEEDPEDEDGEACIPDRCDIDKAIRLVHRYCKNLTHLSLRCGNATSRGLKLVEEIASNLEYFSIAFSFAFTEKFQKSFLMKAPKLHTLCIDGNMQVTGKALASSGRAFKELRLIFCGIDPVTCRKILDNSPNLEVFHGPDCCTIQMLNSCAVRENLVSLKLLMPKFFKDISESFTFLLPFPKLRSLKVIHDLSVHDGILTTLGKWFPNLEKLSIAECDYGEMNLEKFLTEDGIKSLAKLPKLKSLDVSSLKWLKGETLVYLADHTNERLERLKCQRCSKLRDREMIRFVSSCPNLKYLDLSECQNITNIFLSEVLKLMRTRSCKEPLKIRISSSKSCKASAYQKKHPLLIIEDDGFVPDAFYMAMDNLSHFF